MNLLEDIRTAIVAAKKEQNRAATLHAHVLIHADELQSLEPLAFCKAVDVQESYRREFSKMLALSKRLKELGYTITKS